MIGLETHAQLSTASKIFSGASHRLRRRAQHPGLRGRPGAARHAAGAEPRRGRARHPLRPGGRRHGRAAVDLRAQELLLPRPAQGLPDQPVRDPGGAGRHGRVRARRRASARVRLTRAHLEEDAGKSLHEDYHGHDRHRPQPRRHAAAGDRLRARHALQRRGGGLRQGAARAGGLARHLRRQHAGRQLPLRRQRLGAPARRAARHAARDQEPEQLPLPAAGDRLRGAVADRPHRGRPGRSSRPRVLFDPDTGETRAMRSKEDAHDYRYFPDPDLPPLVIAPRLDRARARPRCPSCRRRWRERFQRDDGLPAYDAAMMTQSLAFARYYEAARDGLRPAQAGRQLADGRGVASG
ncbi:MAG: hypothetical protein MZW92_14010 [Comamonadaceae bacterium]|nr:hypothetical protein [Comamonadaceae bacterium]